MLIFYSSKEENIMSDLKTFIKTTRDSRELKRALAVKNTLAGRSWNNVAKELQVCESFIGKWRQIYTEQGVEGLKSGYKGSTGYLSFEAKIDVLGWLKKQPHWSVECLRNYIQKRHDITYRSRQSYYALLHEAKLSWKKTQKRNPKADPEKIKETREVLQKKIRQETPHILNKETVVLFADECHLRWGDTLGYVWGPREERIEVPIVNERERQTYYGVVNLLTGQTFVMPAATGNSEFSVSFLKTLRRNFQGRRLFIIWDRASYHRAHLVTDYLKQINGESLDQERRIHLEYFAPHAPKQNPMEDSWLAAKRWIRSNFFRFDGFEPVKHQFVKFFQKFVLNTKKFGWYFTPQLI